MKQSPAVYPANVLGDTQNRQQIATVLQSMGFETDDIKKAFNVFEKSYGDKKYDISVLTEIVFQIQQNEPTHNEYKSNKIENAIKSHSAPNSPQTDPPSHSQPQPPPQPPTHSHIPKHNEQILHYHSLNNINNINNINSQPPPPPVHNYMNNRPINNNNNNSNDMLTIFNSLKMNENDSNNTIQKDTQRNNLLKCLNSFEKYTSEENEIIEVLLQTLNSNDNDNDVFNNMVNWNDLFNNIKQRKYEWDKFIKNFTNCFMFEQYNKEKHMEIKQKLNKHKSNMNKKKKETNNGIINSNSKDNLVENALEFQYDLKNMNLLNKKDKLLITANTYSILKNNKEKTELMIKKCNEKMNELDIRISELQNEKKQYFNALMRTKNKLSFQIQSIKDTEKSIKELHEQTSKLQSEITTINKTKKSVNKFEFQLNKITNVLKYNFNVRLEPTWNKWDNNEVIIWIKHIENEKYYSYPSLEHIKQSQLSGKDLPQMNDFILRSFKINNKNDRNCILKNIKRIMGLKEYKINNVNNNNNNNNKKKSQLCVICSDGEANHIMIPCGHIASCANCVKQVKQFKKCPFCGNKITNIIKCFHVGL